MSIRMDIELTSARPDGTWTWRKAGAKLPKGDVDASLVPSGSSAGDVVRAEAVQALDGIEITLILPPKGVRKERHERIELIASARPTELVTASLVKGRRDRGDRRDRRGDRGDDRPRGRDDRPARGGEGRSRGPRPEGPRRPERPERPRPDRLRPRRVHRSAVLGELPEPQQVIAEQVLAGGVPAVRQAIARQNEENRKQGLPEITGEELVALAERLLPQLRTAEWRDRADAAMSIIETVDLRDLRSVVVAADAAARDDETRSLASQLKEALSRRVEAEQAEWLAELTATIAEGRIVRALRLSSRPPKAGVPLPADLGTRLKDQAAAALSPDAFADRWATVLDALAFSPVRSAVVPAGLPDPLTDEFKAKVAPFVSRVPQIAQLLGIDPDTAPKPPRRGRPGGERPGRGKARSGEQAPTKTRGSAEPAAEPVETAEPVEAVEPAVPVEAVEPVETAESGSAQQIQDVDGTTEPQP